MSKLSLNPIRFHYLVLIDGYVTVVTWLRSMQSEAFSRKSLMCSVLACSYSRSSVGDGTRALAKKISPMAS